MTVWVEGSEDAQEGFRISYGISPAQLEKNRCNVGMYRSSRRAATLRACPVATGIRQAAWQPVLALQSRCSEELPAFPIDG